MNRYRFILICIAFIFNLRDGGLMHAQVSLTAVDVPYYESFNSLASSGTSSIMPTGWTFIESGAGANGTYVADNGASTIENTYSYGTTSASDRALGQLSGTLSTNFGANYTNNTGVTITSLMIQYTGEQWRLGALGRTDGLNFQYSTNATALNNGTWTDFNVLDFLSPVTTGVVGALDGNVSPNRTTMSGQITGLSISNGASFWIRWESYAAIGADDGVAIDDFTLTANPVLHYTVSTSGNNLVITDIAGNSETLDVSQTGANIRVQATGRNYSLNGGATLPMPADIAIAGLISITINGGTGNDTIEVASFSTSLPDLTLNGGTGDDVVTFTGDINFVSNEFLNVDLQNDDATPGIDQVTFNADADLALSGTGSATIMVSRNVFFNNMASLVSTNGNIIIEANQQATPTTGSFAGISMAGALAQTTGTGQITMQGKGGTGAGAMHGVHIHSGGDVIGGTSNPLTIYGIAGAATGSINMGVFLTGNGSTITSGGANVAVEGIGSTAGSINIGVQVAASGSISAGGSGNVTVEGTGGMVTTTTNDGVRVTGANSIITSSGGNVSVTGFGGGTGAANTNPGVAVLLAGTISAGGSGTVTVTGTGGMTTGTNNFGVQVQAANSTITSSGGNVTVTGTGGGTGSASTAHGVQLQNGGKITAAGNGTVTVEGTGGGGSGSNNNGVFLTNSTSAPMITSSGGNVSVTGQGGGSGSSGNNHGVYLQLSCFISAGGNGDVTVTGTGGTAAGDNNHGVYVYDAGAMITSSGGDISVTGVGGGTGGQFHNGVYIRNGAMISAGGPGNITIQATGGMGTGIFNIGLHALDGTISSHDGDIHITSTGGGNTISAQNYGCILESQSVIYADGIGDITIISNGGNTTGSSNIGAVLDGPSNGIFTLSGDIHITASGHGSGASANNQGIAIQSGSQILAGGPGNITITGTGGDGTATGHFGVIVNGIDSKIATVNGNVNVSGIAGGTGISSFNYGVVLLTGGRILASGSGDVIVEGTGGGEDGADFNHGVLLGFDGGSISSSGGNVAVTGFGGGTGASSDNNYGVFLFDQGSIMSGQGGVVLVQGTGGQGTGIVNVGVGMIANQNRIVGGGPVIINGIEGGGSGGNGLLLDSQSTITTDSLGGNITLVANSIVTSAIIETPDTNMVNIRPHTSGVSIYLGADADAIGGPLKLSDVELDLINTGHLKIGSAQTDSVKVSADITRMDTLDITLLAGGDIVLDTGAIVMSSGNLLLDCGPSPKAIMPLTHGTEVVTDTLSFGSDLLFRINGTIPDSLHDQLRVNGMIKLNGTDLKLSGSYSPLYADTFLIVVNDSTDAVIGTFNGLAEGATIPMFLGSNTPATITYTGGDGNDVVITISTPDYAISQSAGHLVVTDLKDNSDNMTVSQSGSNIRFLVAGRTYSYNYGIFAAMPADISLAGIDSITLNLEGGNDIASINTFSGLFPYLTINGGTGNENIIFAGDITFMPDADFHVDLQDDDPVSGSDQINFTSNTNLVLSGEGSAVMKVSRNITMSSGSSLITSNGDVWMEANAQPTPTAENFSGISVTGAKIEITGTGVLMMLGNAGATAGSNHGIRIESAGEIIGGTTGLMMLEGKGGNSNVGNAHGIFVNGSGSRITSYGADVMVTGFGGGSASGDINCGVDVNTSGLISAGGGGVVTVNGTGGNSAGSNNLGVRVISLGMITSSGSNVTVTGIGKGTSNAGNSHGVSVLLGGIITASGNGVVTVNGTGGVGTGNSNAGIHVNGTGSAIQSAGGNLYVTGNGGGTGASSVNIGVSVTGSGKISPGGMGHLFIEGTGGLTTGTTNYGVNVSQAGSIITTTGGNVDILATGGGISSSSNNYGIAVLSATVTAGGAGTVNIEAYGGSTSGGANHGLFIRNPLSIITSAGGDVTVSGSGGGTGSAGVGVVIENEGIITAGNNGNVNVTGTGALTGSNINRGIYMADLNTKVTSAGGNVNVVGQGGGAMGSGSNNGLLMVSGAMITAGGSGAVMVTGTGGAGSGSNNAGIAMQNANTTITSSGGNVTVTGNGAGTSSGSNYGIEMKSGSIITAGLNGNVLCTGTGGSVPGGSNSGVFLTDTNTMITSNGGNVTVSGTGSGSVSSGSNHGVFLSGAAKILAGGNGHVMVTGQGGLAGGPDNFGINISGAGSEIKSTNGNVTVNGTGGGSTSNQNMGVRIITGAFIGAQGSGNTVVMGQGGSSSGSSNYGVYVVNANASISADQGNIQVTGIGGGTGTSSSNAGVFVGASARIFSDGPGDITITGSGGPSTGSSNAGISLGAAGAEIHAGDGDILMVGEEGGGSSGTGLQVVANTSVSSNTGGIRLSANTMDIFGTVLTSPLDTTQLFPYDTGLRIELTNAANAIGGPLRLSDTKLDRITTGTLTIGHTTCDTISVEIPITRDTATNMRLITAGDVIFNPGTINTNNGLLLLDPGVSPKAVRPLTAGTDVMVDTVSFGSDLAIRINGTIPDTEYDQFCLTGHIDLTGVELMLSGTYTPAEEDSFVIIHNDAVDPIVNTFAGLAEGDTLPNFLGGTLPAVITYIGGDGNDAVIRVVQPCAAPEITLIEVTQDTICEGEQVTLTITTGDLGGATEWHWYDVACGVSPAGTGASIMVTPSDTTTYYVRGEGGCVVNDDCATQTVVVHPYPDATIDRSTSGPCYYTTNTFQPEALPIPGATYQWTFGSGAEPATATGYGPHNVIYTTAGSKTAKLVIHPNAEGAQCPDSTSIVFTINSCPAQILGRVQSTSGNPIASVNVRLFADADSNGIADNSTAIRNIFTSSTGNITMASLTPGHYVLSEVQPNNWLSFDDGDTTPDGDVVPNTDSLDNIIPLTLLPLEFDSMNLFIESPTPGNITGAVFHDINLNQLPDAGEGLENITLQLFKDDNADGIADGAIPEASQNTDASGNFNFLNFQVGNYVLVEIQPGGFISIKDYDQSNDADLVPNTNTLNDTIPLTLTNGETDANNYFINEPSCGLLVTNPNDDGPGSLRYFLSCADSGDTIRFHPSMAGMEVDINSSTLVIDKELVILSDLNPRVIIASSISGLFEIQNVGIATIIGVDIISGLSGGSSGAAIHNEGELLLEDTRIFKNPLLGPGDYLISNQENSQLTIAGDCTIEID